MTKDEALAYFANPCTTDLVLGLQAGHVLATRVRELEGRNYVLGMELLQSQDQLWRVDDVARGAVEAAIAEGHRAMEAK
jgi:hypothetical protein